MLSTMYPLPFLPFGVPVPLPTPFAFPLSLPSAGWPSEMTEALASGRSAERRTSSRWEGGLTREGGKMEERRMGWGRTRVSMAVIWGGWWCVYRGRGRSAAVLDEEKGRERTSMTT